jgi:sigma-B regulation protein RsbU (phosphoserine phosphatase)
LSATAVPNGRLVQVALREDGVRESARPTVAPAGSLPEGVAPDDGVLNDAAGFDDRVDKDPERERLRYLAFVTETMIGTLNTGEAATRLAELVVPRLCDWAVVTVIGEDGAPGQEGRAHCDPVRLADVAVYRDGRLPVTSRDTPMAAALLTGRPVRLPRLDETRIEPTLTSERVRAAWHRLDTTSATIVPLRAREETFGALALMNTGGRPPHSTTEVAIAVEVARRGALALDNARLYGRQLDVAETLQRSLLTPPTHSDPDHLQIAVRYRPAASHQAVGGDWYDAFQQPDGATELVIGDVVGHNVEATAAMSQIRSMLRALAHDQPGSPAHILTRLDRVLTGLHVDKMATALVARVEQPAELAGEGLRTLRWSSAGHVPPLLLRADGRVRVLHTVPERLLGTGWAGTRRDHTVRLHPGDTVLLVTDGLIEQGRCEFDRGLIRLTAALAMLEGVPVEELCDQLLERVVAGRPDDDIAILALRCNRQPA